VLACVLLDGSDPALARRLFAISPLLERLADGAGQVVFLDVAGTSRLHGGAAGLFAAVRRALAPHAPRGLALAGNRFTAEVAARSRRHAVTVPPGDEALFLAQLPLSLLPISASLARRLLPLGLATLGDLAALPLAAVERRYGREGLALHRLARGADERGLLPERASAGRSVECALEHPADRLERLLPVLESALRPLLAALEECGQGALHLRLELHGDGVLPADVADAGSADGVNGTAVAAAGPAADGDATPAGDPRWSWELVCAAPETRVPLLLDLFRLRLVERPPPGAVVGLALEVLAVRAFDRQQTTLFGAPPRDAGRQREAFARLVQQLGPQAVGPPQPRAAHRLEQRWLRAEPAATPSEPPGGAPGATPAAAVEPAALSGRAACPVPARATHGPAVRLRTPPDELVPVLLSGRIVAFRLGRQQLAVAGLSPPRRLEGGWWEQSWARDEHDLLTSDGSRFRICRDLANRRWQLLGELD